MLCHSKVSNCAQCTVLCTALFTECRVVSAAHEPFPAPAAPSVSVEGTVKHPLSLYADFYTAPLSTLTSTLDNSFLQNSFSHTTPTWLAWLHWQLISAESVQHTTESGWWICLCCPRHFFLKKPPHVFLKCVLKLKSLLALIACKCDSLSEPTQYRFDCKFPTTNAVLTVPWASQDRWQHETSCHSDGNQEGCNKAQHYTKYSAENWFLCSIVVTFTRMQVFVSSS